ncbi:hypothetical protein [Oerskovia paurometabola]|uniref:Uncharacterized protein n=1 Tax=Oerskovia paurometabola TaxID=162170 RepID=A0ABW1XE09_9CELL|nr:hypothetical protein [Oerskovia paurometabola]MBM7497342.1 hypothetical protein [Oerskovia paurometabola]
MSLSSPVYWTDVDQHRLQQDLADVHALAPGLAFELPPGVNAPHQGLWTGELPLWPFEREQPDGLTELLAHGLRVNVLCSAAHPVVPPTILPIDPSPLLSERSMNVWHVAPRGQLCLMQSSGSWRPSDRVSDLLLKACGWHVEYALMKAGVVEAMSERGIVEDESRDLLVRCAVEANQMVGSEPGRGADA